MVVVVDMVEVTVVDTHQRKRVVVGFLLDLNATRVVHKASTVDMVEMMMKMKATVDMLVVVVLVLAHLTIHDMVLEQLDYEAHRSWEEEGHRHLEQGHRPTEQERLRSVVEEQLP
jgi:hypothetical protein